MPSAKDIHIAPIAPAIATDLVKRIHYSGSATQNSQLHLGVFLEGALLGAMQFGPPMDKRKVLGIVEGTAWNGMLELNRMAFHDALPRNSESRALGVAFRMIRKQYPHIEWIISFADGTQCGDGTIYRAAGFWLTQIKPNTTIWEAPDGSASATNISLRQANDRDTINAMTKTKGRAIRESGGSASMAPFKEAGWRPKKGFQLRYLKPLWPDVRDRLTCQILPYSAIDDAGARMYRGESDASLSGRPK